MTLDIHETETPGIFGGDFDFGVLEGVLILSNDKDALVEYCAHLDSEDESESDEFDTDEFETGESTSDEDLPAPTAKRQMPKPSGPPRKKARTGSVAPTKTFYFRWRGRETGEGEIMSTERELGTLVFGDTKLAAFNGKVDMAFVGCGVPFRGRKVSDSPCRSNSSWSDFSTTA
jgi:hypothetical protein